MKKGKTFIISGPSGVGKSTVLKALLERRPNVYFSVSATTRDPRPGELDGIHYHFMDVESFRKWISMDQFLEYAEYVGNFYGTPKRFVDEAMDEAEKTVNWFKGVFGDDYYLEIQRFPCLGDNPARDVWERQQAVIPFIMELGRKTGVKVIATNDSHFLNKDLADAHERLICLSTNRTLADGSSTSRMPTR